MSCQQCKECIFQVPDIHLGPDVYYETHITIHSAQKHRIENFGLKIIEIKIDEDESAEFTKEIPQVMTSSSIKATSDSQYHVHLRALLSKFKAAGVMVLRVKTETTLNHPIPMMGFAKNQDSYYEAHFVFEKDSETLAILAKRYGLVGSKNLMKKADSTSKIYTLRKYEGTSAEFIQLVNMLKHVYNNQGLKEVIMECALYDTLRNQHCYPGILLGYESRY